MKLNIRRLVFDFLIFGTGLLLSTAQVKANEADTLSNKSEQPEKKEAFKPGEIIFEHIGDSYSWPIATFKDVEVAIPLPVIVYSKTSGVHVFFSSKFDHGHASYQGLEIAKEGKEKGKIVEVQPDGTTIKPIDISITKNVLSLFISLGLMLWMFISIARRYVREPDKAPKGLQSFLEPLILFVRDDIGIPSIGKERHEKYMPYLLTVFFFILINNMMGLIPIFPGGANLTGNIAVTMVLAILTFIITMVSTNKGFWVHIVNTPGVPWWLKLPVPLMPFIEFSSSIVIRPFVLMIRLFANITAGHINVLSFIMLIFIFGAMKPAIGWSFSPFSVAFVVFIYFIELLVAFIQAYVFTLLSALYFGMAKEESHH
ncbi:MAG: F0F1 ATP synthase subunit A [Bacteroidota bacterium]|nr:F0F1 ATP synthase subunit A [Bacteroidota bacterium]